MTIEKARKKHRRLLEKAANAGDDGNHDKAERLWKQYLEHFPNDPDVLFNVGVCIMRRSSGIADRCEAAEYFHRVVSCVECRMERKADAMNNLGNIAEKAGHTEKAAICYGFAVKMWPNHKAAKTNLGDCHRFFGNFEEADKEYREVLSMDDASPEANFCAGMIALLLGDFTRGWAGYEHRFDMDTFPTKPIKSKIPKWAGEDLNGKTILLTQEQGWGDQIQFIRYAGELKKKWSDCTVWLYCGTAIVKLMEAAEGVDSVFDCIHEPDGTVSIGDMESGGYDFHCPLLSLPHRLGTTLAAIPNKVPYIHLSQGRELRANIANVGIVWAGSPLHGKDKWRSVEPELFQPLIDAYPNINWISLQCGPRAHECSRLNDVTDLSPVLNAWEKTAHAIQNLDLVISVDTAIVHLAGALNVPVWMLTPNSPDWRWMLTREDSPWYPNMRLFRQTNREDWETPMKRIIEALK